MKKVIASIKKALLWLWMLEKRAFKKPAFLVILLLMPLLTAALSSVVGETRGFLSVAVCWDESDEAAEAFGREMLALNGVIRAHRALSEEDAREEVEGNAANFAWIIPKGFDEHLKNFVNGKEDSVAVIVVEKEESAVTSLVRERLFTLLFPRISYTLFRERVLSVGASPAPTEEEMRQLYRAGHEEGIRVEFRDVSGKEVKMGKVLTAPARGLLALLLAEGGVAAAILCAEDEKKGVYLMLAPSRRVPLRAATVFVFAADLAVAAYVSLWLGGLMTDPGYEAVLIALYALAAWGFSLLLLALLRTPGRLAVAALFTAVLTLALTPVFLDLSGATPLSALLPSYHYLKGVYSSRSALTLLLYAAVTALAAVCVESVLLRRQK